MMWRMSLTTQPSSKAAGSLVVSSSKKCCEWGTMLPAFRTGTRNFLPSPSHVAAGFATESSCDAHWHARTRAVIITDEHVAHVGLREPRGDHPAVDAGEEHGFRLKLINRRTVGEPALSQNNSLYNLELLTVGLSFTCTNCFTICSFFTLLYLIIPRRMRSMLTMSNKLPVLPSLGRTQRSR
jgi:hypothetical protein